VFPWARRHRRGILFPPQPAEHLGATHLPASIRRSKAGLSKVRCAAIAPCGGSCWWDVDHAGCTWVVTLSSPEEQTFCGRALEEALAWCLVWLMAPELGIEPFLV
jgi:hypothetical protein